jgi:integrase
MTLRAPGPSRRWAVDPVRVQIGAEEAEAQPYLLTVELAQGPAPHQVAEHASLEFHGLRHTFASLMIAAGANPLQFAEALGHTDGPDGLTRCSCGNATGTSIRV